VLRKRIGSVACLLSALALAVAVDAASRRRSGPLSVQSRRNLYFLAQTQRASVKEALREHPRQRPPLYPLLLYAGERAGVPPRRGNEILLAATLLLIYVYGRRAIPGLHPLVPTALFALLHFNYVASYQLTAEVLFVPLGLGLLLVLATGPLGPARVAVLAVLAGALGATRYFGVMTLTPLVGLHVLFRGSGDRWRRALLTVVYGAVALAPVAAWLAIAYSDTGYWTGADRVADRNLPPRLAHWHALEGLAPSLVLWGRTVFLDFFSFGSYAALSVVTRPLDPSVAEILTATLGLVALAIAAVALRKELPRPAAPASLCAQFFVVYNVALIVVWCFVNNDPLYSRFLWPGYVFLVLFVVHGYEAPSQRGKHPVRRWLLVALAAALVLIHLTRHVAAPALPYR
jgi:hypothetical protein